MKKITITFEVNEEDLPSEKIREYQDTILDALNLCLVCKLLPKAQEKLAVKLLHDVNNSSE